MKIDNYQFGKITIDGKQYTKDLKIFPDKIKDNWWRSRGHLLQEGDLKDVWEEKPNRLIVGKGARGVMDVDKKVEKKAKELDIELIVEKSGEACERYNQLSGEEKNNTVLAIHLTC